MPSWPVALDPETNRAPAMLDAERENWLARKARAVRDANIWSRSECMQEGAGQRKARERMTPFTGVEVHVTRQRLNAASRNTWSA